MGKLVTWPGDPPGQRELALTAAVVLRTGGLVVFPTDTVYGLGGDPSRPEAIQRIYDVKGRPDEKAIIWLLDSLRNAEKPCQVSEPARRLAAAFWPGALTLVLPLRRRARGQVATLGVRVPRHDTALTLIRAAGGRIATTSANRSGLPSARTADEAADQIGEHVDLIIDAGRTPGGVESTIVDLSVDPPAVLRAGAVDAMFIDAVLGRATVSPGRLL